MASPIPVANASQSPIPSKLANANFRMMRRFDIRFTTRSSFDRRMHKVLG
jgi:hypothetical protein